ncbi:hypothetical protein E8E12_002086 [Didymella heteroderae]|uniref:BTB domain-containing protein n=1 Tax=Didymella heteroderae TaxID=1769908 RepID=A0A9P4WQP5_9PLEO|nr:hypothetical protein E8E12_002086 [Didymella heteroderae]
MSNNQQPAVPKPPPQPPAIGHVSVDGMATVVIGPSASTYLVHKVLITHHSEYFSKALSRPWMEAEDLIVVLAGVGEEECEFREDCDQDNTYIPMVNLFVHWLYTQRIPHDYDAFKSVTRRPDAPRGYNMGMTLVLAKAYALGDRILASTFRRVANDTLIGLTSAYLWTPYFCESWSPEDDENNDQDALSELPPAFTVRVMRRLAYLRRGRYEGCYVEHNDDEEQKSCKKSHMEYAGGEYGHGYFGEPKPDDD